MTSPPVPFTLTTLPKTLPDWICSGWEPAGTFPRDVWTPLEPFFLEQGLILWEKIPGQLWGHCTRSPNNLPRCPDAFVYITQVREISQQPERFDLLKAAHCPARTLGNQDVLIRLVARGQHGLNHLAALRRLGTGLVAFRGENHILPMLREIVLEDMVFAVFPLMRGGFDSPWYYNYAEVIDAIYQVTEGLAFCHERLVAHLDIDTDNILINFLGTGACQAGVTQMNGVLGLPTPFRECFPTRYYLNDFELAACFDPESDPSTRVISGLPTRGPGSQYLRVPAPEMLFDQPYCPFMADVWQLGRMFLECFQHLDESWTPLKKLFREMTSENPRCRPTMSQALEHIRQLRSTLSPQALASRVPRPPAPESPVNRISEESRKPANDDVPDLVSGNAPESDESVSG